MPRTWILWLLTISLVMAGGCDDTDDDDSSAADDDDSVDDDDDDDIGDDDVDWDPADFDHVYEVGEGLAYEDPCVVPWESLAPDSLVRIHYRAEPYTCKWVINTAATEDSPVVVLGVPAGDELPVISGDGAVARQELDYWNEDRSVIKVGGSSLPNEEVVPSYIYIERLSVRSARAPYTFTDEGGSQDTYTDSASAIHVEVGAHITIRDCELHDSANGFFAGHQASDLLLHGNYIHSNGLDGSIYQHNNYTEAFGITFEYNRFGPLRPNCDGNNLKDRSAGTVVRYNWIEGGNRQLDLVESDYSEFTGDPSYRQTFVYGNVLIEPDEAGNSQILHYGGDGGDESMYRKGTLYFHHNTIISTRDGNVTLLRLSTDDESADCRNNVLYATAGGDHWAVSAGDGHVTLGNNWLPLGWRDTHEAVLDGTVTDQGNTEGHEPGFVDFNIQEFGLVTTADARDRGGELAAEALPDHVVARQYVKHQDSEARPDDGSPDAGAYEFE